MNLDLTGCRAVVTGGSSGLGLAMAEALLEHGGTVAISSRPGERLDRAVSGFVAKGHRAVPLPMDVRSEPSVAEAARRAVDLLGGIDLLINSAGIGMPRVNPDFVASPKPFYDMDVDGVRDVIETNFIGCFTVSKYFVRPMLRAGRGRIVNISTSLRTMTMPYGMPYGPAKAGAEALTSIMAAELKEAGVAVNILLPSGAVDTPLMTEKNRADFLRSGSLLDAAIMKRPVLFLASEAAEGLSGERLIATEFDLWLHERDLSF